MAPPNSNHWITDPEYAGLLNYLIEETENVESPVNIHQLVRKFKEKSGAAQAVNCIRMRIDSLRTRIHSFDHIDSKSKVKILFALSSPVNPEFLEELKKDAFVEVDEKQRIIHYEASDGSFELKSNQRRSASAKTKPAGRGLRSLTRDYFENKNDVDAVSANEEEKELWNFFEFIAEKCENVNSPLSFRRLVKDFNMHFGISRSFTCILKRIRSYCREIQKEEFLDNQTNVKQLFGLSATVNSDYLEILRKAARIEVDKKNRITYYKAKDKSLELRGDHSSSAKTKSVIHESQGRRRSLIKNYFENKNNANAIPKNEKKREMWKLIEFVIAKCENINSPLSIRQLTKDFNLHFGLSRSFDCIYTRIRRYCHEIQKAEFLDTHSKVEQLFGLKAKLDSDCLEKLREDADVEVDNLNRITKYTSKNGLLTLHGDHSLSANQNLAWRKSRMNRKTVKNYCNSGDEDEESETANGYSDDDSDEYSSEEFDSEFDSDEENNPLDETEDLTEPSNEAVDFDNETPVRNRSATEISIDDNLDFDPPTESSHRSEANEIREDQENDPGLMENTSVKTRYGRLSKKRHLDTELSYNLASSRNLGASMNADPGSSKPAKQKKIAIEKASSSPNQIRCPSKSIRSSSLFPRDSLFPSFSTESGESMENQDAIRAGDNPSDYQRPRIQGIEDYDYNPRGDNTPESSPIDNQIEEPEQSAAEDHNANIEAQNTDNRSDAVASEHQPEKESLSLQNETNSTTPSKENEVVSQKIPVKLENEEPILAEDPTEDVKPVTAHNPKIKFFEAMHSLILFLDTPSLFNLQSKIQQRIQKMKGSKEVLQNNELIPALELLVARMANHSVMNISGSVESVGIIQFFCYLKASILNSKMSGVERLMINISGLIEKSQNKRIPMKKVANALRATLDIDSF